MVCYTPERLVYIYITLLFALERFPHLFKKGVNILATDVACTFVANMKNNFHGFLKKLNIAKCCPDKMHEKDHITPCLLKYSSTFVDGTGYIGGENAEIVFSTLRGFAPTLSTMGDSNYYMHLENNISIQGQY